MYRYNTTPLTWYLTEYFSVFHARIHLLSFAVREGNVGLRDWTSDSYSDYRASRNKKRPNSSTKAQEKRKSKQCFFFENHPDGCPLDAKNCRFAHGKEELGTWSTRTSSQSYKDFTPKGNNGASTWLQHCINIQTYIIHILMNLHILVGLCVHTIGLGHQLYNLLRHLNSIGRGNSGGEISEGHWNC